MNLIEHTVLKSRKTLALRLMRVGRKTNAGTLRIQPETSYPQPRSNKKRLLKGRY